MTDRKKSKIPFVGLHAHSVYSVYDGLGFPDEHMEYAYSNGSGALALTDHGNMNGLAHQVLHAKKMKKAGKDFKPIFGVEAYFHHDLNEWHNQKAEIDEANKGKRKKKKEETSGVTVEDEDATKQGIKNILNKRRHLILLAQNQTGLSNIFKLISKSYSEDCFYRFPRIDYKMLEEHNEGIIAASACLGGVYAGDFWENRLESEEAVLNAMRETTKKMQSIFGDRWYAELQWNSIEEQHDLNQLIIKVAKEFGVKLISTADSHYPSPEAWKDRILYKKLGWVGSKGTDSVDLPSSIEEVGYELYPKNGDQMWETYKNVSEKVGVKYDDELVLQSFAETHDIAFNRIEDFMPDNTVRLPDFVVPEGQTAEEALTELAGEGLANMKFRSRFHKEDCTKRLEYELSVIKERGFSKYFLTMKAISDRAKETQLVGPGRGSAAGALTAYVLGITQVEPITWGLQFERFLRKDATDYPDIDYDVSDPMLLKEALVEEWGEDKVAPISNWNTLQLRSLIKDISKFYNIPFQEVNLVTGKMLHEATPLAKKKHGITAGVYTPTFEEVMEFSESLREFLKKYPHVKTHVEALHGSIKSCSRHAGGVVISENLDSCMPLINSKGVRQTPWSEGQNVRHLEPMGFIKFDVLGLASLRMIEGAIRHILKRHYGVKKPTFKDVREYYEKNLSPDNNKFDDQSVFENVFHAGKWAGVFQFTERGAQNFCRLAKPRSVIDLAAITSVFRPGPLNAKVHEQYIDTKEFPEDVEYLNPLVKKETEETHGFLIFQEQIASLAHKLGRNISLDEGNMLRKVLTKKGTGKEAEVKNSLHDRFIEGCVLKGISEKEANDMWKKFEFFSGYGFNKSHAVSYSIISYQCAWLLNYYPVEWMAAFLDKEPETKKERAINIAKSMGFEIEGVDVNKSGIVWEISPDGKTLIQPLSSIKGVGESAIKEILDNRPFNTLEEFLFHPRVSYSKLNKKNLDALCRSGALNQYMDERFTGGKHFWSAVAVDRPRKPKNLEDNIELYAPEGEFTKDEKISNQVDLTGIYPVGMIMPEEIRKSLEEKYIPPLGEFDPDLSLCWFIPKSAVKKKTSRGKDYLILEVIDDTNKVTPIKCWNYKPKRDAIFLNRPYVAKLKYDEQWGYSTYSVKNSFKLIG